MLRMDARVQKEGGQIMKAAIYCRLSKEDEDKIGESESIQNQKSMLLQYALENGFEIYQIYSDEDYSGIDRNRPAFNSMLQAASEHQFDVVLAKTQSRFTRDMELVEKYLHGKFMEWGVRFIAVVDHVDTNDTANKKSRQINGLINEWYLEDLSTNVRSVLDHKRKEGLFIGSFARYGYCKDPNAKGKLIIDPEAADVVRRIFSMALNGIGAHKIARILNDEKIPSPTAYKQLHGIHYRSALKNTNAALWSSPTVYQILHDQLYIGNMVQGKHKKVSYKSEKTIWLPKSQWIVVENTHEPIIDEETFEAVQKIAGQKKNEYHERLGKFSYLEQSENLLKGLVWCPNCQRPLVRYKNVSHGKKLWYTYICPGHADDPNRCSFVSIREDELNEVLFTAIQSQIQIAADLQEVIKRLNAEPEYRRQRSDAASKLETARRTLKRSQSLYDSLYQNYVEQLMTEQEYVTLKARYKAEAEKAEQLIAALEQEQLESKVYTAENRFLTESRSFMGTDKLTKEMASALVERIYVDADKNIDIRLRYRDEYMALLKFIEGRAAV